jgi:ApbE superfamily uncharacterized protein (UPF0280 family)
MLQILDMNSITKETLSIHTNQTPQMAEVGTSVKPKDARGVCCIQGCLGVQIEVKHLYTHAHIIFRSL